MEVLLCSMPMTYVSTTSEYLNQINLHH